LGIAVRANTAHLQKLRLDFLSWRQLGDNLGYFSDDNDDDDDDDDDGGSCRQRYFVDDILRLDDNAPGPLFPQIRVLHLSSVPLVATVAHAINFDTLVSLTLRVCPGYDDLLSEVLKLRCPIKLKALEIQEATTGLRMEHFYEYALRDFLDSFEGLEELFINQQGPQDSIRSWKGIARRHATLKRFVHHQRTVDLDEDSPYFEEEIDLPNLAIRDLDIDPNENPLSSLDLEFVGLACVPELLVSGSKSTDEDNVLIAVAEMCPAAFQVEVESKGPAYSPVGCRLGTSKIVVGHS
jgi:hypothetical protein